MPQVEECMYLDYSDTTEPDYSNEIWYQDIMYAYQSEKEYEQF